MKSLQNSRIGKQFQPARNNYFFRIIASLIQVKRVNLVSFEINRVTIQMRLILHLNKVS